MSSWGFNTDQLPQECKGGISGTKPELLGLMSASKFFSSSGRSLNYQNQRNTHTQPHSIIRIKHHNYIPQLYLNTYIHRVATNQWRGHSVFGS